MASSVAPDRDQVCCPSINIRPSTAPRAVRLVSATSLAYLCQGAIIWVNQICIAVGTAEELIGMRTIATYLTGRRNLAGSGLALLAGALVLVDPVGLQGIVLVIGFYLAGALAVRGNPKVHRFGFDPMQVQRSLSEEIAAVAGRVPPAITIRIQRIELTIRSEILPRLDCLPLGAPELYLVERTARDFLPTAVETYLRLPGGYASSRGATAYQVLVDQLELLEAQMRRVAEVVHRADMDRLLAHRRFLEDRFNRLDLSG